MKNILITGASGFVGSHLARRLIKEGHNVTIFLRRLHSDTWRIADFYSKVNIEWVNLEDALEVHQAIKRTKPDIIYHMAANKASCEASSAPRDISTNINGTWNLLQALSDTDYELFVNIGSSSEYGTKYKPMHENDVLVPNSYHSFAKAAQTLLCQACADVENKPIVTLRLFSVYGPFERSDRLISTVIHNTLKQKTLKLSSPYVSRDFVYIDDVIEACLKIDRLKLHVGKIINIGTGTQHSIQDVVDTVFKLTKQDTSIMWGSDSRSWDTTTWVADRTRSIYTICWMPQHTLKDGLKKTIDWHKKMLWK